MTTKPAAPLFTFESFDDAAACVDELTTPATAGQFIIIEPRANVYQVIQLDNNSDGINP